MEKRRLWIGLCILALALVGCKAQATPLPSPVEEKATAASTAVTPSDRAIPKESDGVVLLSELLLAAPDNNNLEFIELFNAGTRPVDLNGWSLWYQLASGQAEKLIHAWEEPADVPGYGHYLLARAGQAIGLIGDAEYDIALFETKGGLALRDAAGETVDVLGWGDAPEGFFNGRAAAVPEKGVSLERWPGGEAGNGTDSGDNRADFSPAGPNPQNSGSDITPIPGGRLTFRLQIPATVEPGSEVEALVEVQNLTGAAVHDLLVSVPLPDGFEAIGLPDGASHAGRRVEWTVSELAGGESETATIVLSSPWTYLTTMVRGAYAQAADWPLRAYGPPLSIAIAGGSIPIATARSLAGQVVTIEGTATMYTDAFYAGSTGTKFYLEDESSGIQVFCPGGLGIVAAGLGDRIRVTGEIEVYRGSLEIIPGVYDEDIEILERGAAEWEPAQITIRAAGSDESVLGRLNVVQGAATRIEEFSFSCEVDLVDDTGYMILLYIEKETGVSVEPLELGRSYRVTGISELYDTDWQLKPRLQTDLMPVFPPELALEMKVENSVPAGGVLHYSLIAYNHTAAPLSNVRIVAQQPADGAAIDEVMDGGEREGDAVVWRLPELAAGGSATVRYTAVVSQEAEGRILTLPAVATADQWPEPAASGTDPLLTFVGEGVPIWAIQGGGAESPYVRGQAATQGVVIGVFPELDGFWIQETQTDEDPATSAGLFVLTGELEAAVELGDLVRVTGQVREKSGQTVLQLLALEDLMVVASGQQLPAATELDPPPDRQEAAIYYEALEGMLVQVTGPAVAIAPTSKYGEAVLVRSDRGVDRLTYGLDTASTGLMIFVDDGSEATHYDLSTLPFALQSGDRVANLAGPLAFTFDNFKIEPIRVPQVIPTGRPLPGLEEAGEQQFSVATFNVENLFDFQDPHPSDPPRPSLAEYRLKLTKTAAAIVAMGAPTIIGLQEVEHLGILEDLVEQETIAGFGYQPFLVEGTDSRGIDVAYLVRGDQATVEGAAAYAAPEGLTSRPPLLITVTLKMEGAPTVYLLNNHFTSMSGGEAPTEPRRTAQAEWNLTLVQRILADDPQAHVMVMGDLNSYYDARPVEVLREGGLRHVYELVEPIRPYSYIYQGESETLDHILVTPSLYALLVQVEALHINADYPPAIPDDPSPRRVSDHDPVVAVFSLE